MPKYYEEQQLGKIYTVSARPSRFWRKRMKWLPYFVGSKIHLEVTIVSSREQGIGGMELTYFDFIEKMPGEQPQIITVDEENLRIHNKDKQKGMIHSMNVRAIPRVGNVEYNLTDKVTHEDVMLFSDAVAFPYSSKNTAKMLYVIFSALVTLICSVISGVTVYMLTH